MAMSKKDYVVVAAAINEAAYTSKGLADAESRADELARVADMLSEVFAADNPRFDRAKFLAACGVA